MTIPDSELAPSHFKTVFNNIADKHVPFKRWRVQNRLNSWFTPELSEFIRNRDVAWAMARSTDSGRDWQSFRKLRNLCVKLIRKAKSNYYINTLADCTGNPYKFWETVRTLKCSLTLPLQMNVASETITDQSDIINEFNQHFTFAGSLFDRIQKPTHCDNVLDFVEKVRQGFPLWLFRHPCCDVDIRH